MQIPIAGAWSMRVYLTGGLGNQLFQLSAALNSYTGKIELIEDLGLPRVNKDGKPEIASFVLPERVTFRKSPRIGRFLSQKVIGFNLRINLSASRLEQKSKWIFACLANILLSLIQLRVTILKVGDGVGYSEISKPTRRTLLVGYFQSYRYLLGKSELLMLRQQSKSLLFSELENEYKDADLAIHIRVGDYQNEPRIGILSRDYYLKAVESLKLSGPPKVVVFTDSPTEVESFLPMDKFSKFQIVPTNISSAETLLLMSGFSRIIIGNSTFSWWAAMVNNSGGEKVVVAPKPWFIAQESPIDLIPQGWIQVQR